MCPWRDSFIQTTAPYNPGTIVTMLGVPCSIAKIPEQVFSHGKSEWRMYIDWEDIQDTFLQDLYVLEVLMDDFLKSYLERWHDSAVLQNGAFWQIWRVILKMESQSRGPASRNVIWCSASCTLCKNRKGKCRARLSLAVSCCLPGLSARRNTRLWLLLLELLPIAFVKMKHLVRHMQHWKNSPTEGGVL